MSIDYSEKMNDLIFEYDEKFRPSELPDPQIDPIIPGSRIPLKKSSEGVYIPPRIHYIRYIKRRTPHDHQRKPHRFVHRYC